MALSHSPKIITEGLAFYYDMSNSKKSWKGAPTENLIALSGADAAIERSGTSYPYFSANITSLVQSRWSPTNNKLSMSFEGKRDFSIGGTGGGNDGYPSMYIYFTDWSWASSFGQSSYDWTNTVQNNITMPNPAGKSIYFSIYHMNAGNPGKSYSRNHQVEFGSFATPFVNGARTNTQAILDLTNNNTITANSLTYAADGTFSFNGSSNYADCGNSTSLQHSSSITMSAWVNPVSSTALGNIMAKNSNSGYRFRIQNGSLWWYVSGNSITGGSVPNNVWSFVTVTGDNTGLKAYVNGVLVASNTTVFTPSAPTVGNLYLGCLLPSSEPFNGKISSGSIYNRALTAAEVQQNFQALRGRYGI